MENDWLRQLNASLDDLNRSQDWDAWQAARAQVVGVLAAADATLPAVEARLVDFGDSGHGHFREAAVRQLGRGRSEAAFRMLVKRRNDWVPQVRQAAAQASADFVVPEQGDLLLACLGDVLALARGGRADHAPFVALVDDALGAPQNREKVLRAFGRARGAVARHLLLLMLGWSADWVPRVIDAAVRHADFTVRLGLLRACAERSVAGEEALLARLVDDPHPKIRKAALVRLCEEYRDGEAVAPALERCLFDPASTVRDWVLWCYRGREAEVAARLQQALAAWAGDARIAVALLGLIVATRAVEHLPFVQRAFADPRPAVRCAALAAWATLDRERADVPVMTALSDGSRRVYKLASLLLDKGKVVLAGEQLRAAACAAAAEPDFGRLLAIVHRLPFWERLEALLGCVGLIRSEEDEQQVVAALRAWERRQVYAFSSLPPQTQARLRAAVADGPVLALWRRRPRLASVLAQFGVAPEVV